MTDQLVEEFDLNKVEVHVQTIIDQHTKHLLIRKVKKIKNLGKTDKISIPEAVKTAIEHFIKCEVTA
jgi:hypothetical protein